MIDEIITDVLKAEGWDKYTNDPLDRGGPTKWGITQKAWADWRSRDVTPEEVQQITEAQARDFYEAEYVIGPRFNHLPERLIAMVVDAGVNHGTRRAAKWIQRAAGVKEDGVIGPVSTAAIQSQNPVALYVKFIGYRFRFYGRIVRDDPSQARFIAGWSNRAAKWLDRLADTL
jgi:lysozyme family protein